MHDKTNTAPVSQGAQENESVYVIFYGSPITICGYALSREEAINICEEHHKERPVPRYVYMKIPRLHDAEGVKPQ